MKKLVFCILTAFISLSYADEMTVEKFKKIMKGKETDKVRKELQFCPTFKKARVKITFSYPDREDFTGYSKAEEKYLEGKYILTTMFLPNDIKLYSVMLWNDKDKVIEVWHLSPDNILKKVTGKPSKKKDRYLWEGTFPDGIKYKGYTDYSKKLISWEGKYYDKDGKVLYSESGNAVPVD